MEELKSPPPLCPNTVTVRRNPPRRARPTPYSAAPPSSSKPPPSASAIRSFPIDDILSINIPEPPSCSEKQPQSSEKLKVFLRIRPPVVVPTQPKPQSKNAWPQNPNKKTEGSRKATESKNKKSSSNGGEDACLKVIDSYSVTLCPPQSVVDVRRTKSEVYQGFSCVFSPQSTQNEVYEKMVNPLVDDFLKGKSGMLAAMGPSGSGKTHTVFGTNRDPGMVSLALRHIFSENNDNGPKFSRTFYLSMFEIYSERGKGEKIMDLSHEGGDLYMQQSNIKGLKEVVIHDVQHAESLIASGMLRRSTAMTNSNLQSSRSQCIINIRSGLDNLLEDAAAQSCTATLTIVDLAGAEREKKTGNQGARLLESNFINNTSMVFGLCLRSLLEHQKNPKKAFHKHSQNSLLTKYLRDFLEGKKRMALILTAKPGADDYQDTSYLLRQAAPFMNIKFENVEEQPANTLGNKRRTQALLKAEQVKRMKLNSIGVSMDDEVKCGDHCEPHKEDPGSIELESEKNNLSKEIITKSLKRAKENQILLNISIAMWNVLKECKKKLQASENEVDTLRRSLTIETERCTALETELILVKASCSCGKEVGEEFLVPKEYEVEALSTTCLLELQRHQSVDVHEIDTQVSCSNSCEGHVDTRRVSSINCTSSAEFTSTPPIAQNVEEQSSEKNNVSCEYVLFDKHDLTELGDTEFISEVADGDKVSSHVKGDQRKHGQHEQSAQVSPSDPSESEIFQKQEVLDDTVKIDLELSSVEVVSISNDLEKFEVQSNEKVDASSPSVVVGKQEFKEVEKRETTEQLTGCDNTESAVCDSELPVLGENISSVLKVDEWKAAEEDSTAQVSSSSPREAECFEKHDVLDDTGVTSVEVVSISSDPEKLDEQSNEIVDFSSPSFVCDKKNARDGEITGSDTLHPVGQDSELPCIVGDNISLSLVEDQPEQEEKESTAQVSSSSPREAECFEKYDVLDDTGVSSVEVASISSDPEKLDEQSNEIVDVSSPSSACDKKNLRDVDEKEANGEKTVGDEVSLSLVEDQPVQEEKEVIFTRSSSVLDVSKCEQKIHLLDSTDVPDQQLVLPNDVMGSQKSDASKFLEASSVQSCQSSSVKPKRRLRPASSMMLRNLNVSDFDEVTEMPKQHGKRGQKENVVDKRTQDGISLLRLLNPNLHR